jgi:hypothetical protein
MRALRPQEFRRRLVELARLGCSPEELAEEFRVPAAEIRAWVRWQTLGEAIRRRGPIRGADQGARPGPSSAATDRAAPCPR